TLSNILTFERSNSSDPLQDNTGFSLLFQHIDDAGEVENISMISSIFTDVSNGSERSALSFYTGYGDGNGIISNLSSSEALRINANLSTTIFGDLAVLGNSYLGTLTFTDNGTFPDSILTDFIYPESSVDTSIENLTVLRDVHILGSLYGGSPLNVDSLAHFTSNVTFADNFTVDGSTFYVDASNNRIGIGTTTPQAMLEISNSSALSVPWLNITSGGTDAKFIIDTTAGNVGIGTATPTGDTQKVLDIVGSTSSGAGVFLHDSTSGGASSDGGTLQFANGVTYLYNRENNDIRFGTNDSETMRIDSAGNVGIGDTTPSARLDVSSSAATYVARLINTQTGGNSAGVLIQGGTNAGNEALNVKTSAAGQLFLVDANGETYVNTATDSGAYNLQVAGNICETDTSVSACSSDARLKENIRPLNSGLNLILSLEPKTFNFIGDSKTHAGLIAQDVQANPLTSNWIQQHDSDIYLTWDDSDYLKFSMIKAIQEQQEIIKSQEKRIRALEEAQR
ncbi:tail fiber domain-containing protein, partial [Candidatus Woesearchaeota archaeon]|nr:tail fiber domain-containing protein [Candidatus Woesearchaeota archaeon]